MTVKTQERKLEGRFIVIEGPDGAGCSTQVAKLQQYLETTEYFIERRIRCEATREPSDGPFGTEIRKALQGRIRFNREALALAYAADRADHLDHLRLQPARDKHGEADHQSWEPVNTGIEALLRSGVWVISDRYVLSSLAYQSSQGLDPEWIAMINNHEKMRTPDVTILLNTELKECKQRLLSRSIHLELFDDPNILAEVQSQFNQLLPKYGSRFAGTTYTVTGMGTSKEVHKRIVKKISEHFLELQVPYAGE